MTDSTATLQQSKKKLSYSHTPNNTIHTSKPTMTFVRALKAQMLCLRHSALVPLHLVCALVAGLACGLYFAVSSWNITLGFDAFVQLLGALMPLMAGIVCGLDVNAEEEATKLSGLLSAVSRQQALFARLALLWLMGVGTLAVTIVIFALVLLVAARDVPEVSVWLAGIGGLALGSIPLYLMLYATALQWGRNAAISIGALGLILAFFSVGGLAHGLMTGELTATALNMFAYLPTSWAIILGSAPIEWAVAAGAASFTDTLDAVISTVQLMMGLCMIGSALFAGSMAIWISRFEPTQRGE